MFRFFENLVDPYVEYTQQDAPPKKLWPFFRVYSAPFKKVFILTAIMSVAVAAIEIGLIYYMGRLVDLLSGSPAGVSGFRCHFLFLGIFDRGRDTARYC